MQSKQVQWAAPGDVNAFFGLMLDNIADLVLTVSLLGVVFEFPTTFALQNMVPGTAIGVLVGDLLFFWMAIRLAKRTGRSDVTAMPLGLDTPSTFGMIFFVLGPAFLAKKGQLAELGNLTPEQIETQAAIYTWHIGICSIVISGLFKFCCAVGSSWIRRVVPRAGLLGSLTAVALVLISFLPLIEILHYPIAGLAALAVVLTCLVARVAAPFRMPGALAAVLVGVVLYYLTGLFEPHASTGQVQPWSLPTGWLTVFQFGWLQHLGDSLAYMPVVIPFALGTVIGGIDCTESAAAAGDDYNTNKIIGVEALATLVAGLCGGVIQTTPYIGHPAYKAMGGRAAYTLATALFVGGAGLFGYFEYLYLFIPKSAVFPILIFIGLEITAQSFQATPKKHYAAIGLACVPALAALILIYTDNLQGQYSFWVGNVNQNVVKLEGELQEQRSELSEIIENLKANSGDPKLVKRLEQMQSKELAALPPLRDAGTALEKMAGNPAKNLISEPADEIGKNLQTIRMLAGGFIVTSLLWASGMAAIIDRRFLVAATYFGIGAVCSLFGVIHSPLPGSPLVIPWNLPENLPSTAAGQTPIHMAIAYLIVAGLLISFHFLAAMQDLGSASPDEESA